MSKYYVIPNNIPINDDDESQENCMILTDYVAEHLDGIKDGDVLGPPIELQYRNSGCYLWDGVERAVVCFSSDLDDYGCLPPSFNIKRFGIHHFDNVLMHNSYVRIPQDYIGQIVNTSVYGIPPKGFSKNPTDKIVWAYFFVGYIKYYVIGIPMDVGGQKQAIVGGNEDGLVISTHEFSNPQYEKDTPEYAADFMRMFIDNVRSSLIESIPTEDGYDVSDNILYVTC